jgi:hypothetical protein
MATSFKTDIAPIFGPFVAQMIWRFDLSNYDHVKANAPLIYTHIQQPGGDMPPAPYPPLRDEDIATFVQWMAEGCPP